MTLPTNSSRLSPAQAAQHLLNRRRARTDPVEYAGYIDVPARPVNDDPDCELFYPVETNLAPHHQLVLETMDRTSSRDYGRAIIMMPPGTAKTTYASVVYPSYYLGKNPGHRLILVTYGADLAKTMGHKTRSIIKQQRYQRLFDTELLADSRAADHFQLTSGGEYHATGYGGDLPGRRAEGAICDDIIKGIAEASSQTERDNVWNAYNNNLLTRLLPRAWLVVIMTHWDEDDPCGRILPDSWSGDSGMFVGRDGLDWEVLCIQAQCETTTDPLKRTVGQYLQITTASDDTKHWELHKRDARKWNALYQQRPRPLEGAFFAASDMLVNDKPIETPKLVDAVFAVIDSAMKDGKSHDGIAAMFFALTRLNLPMNPPLAVLDWDLQQIKGAFLNVWIPSVFIRLEEFAKECGARAGSIGVFVEDASSGTVLLQQTDQSRPEWALEHPDWVTHAIDSALTKQGKKGKAANASGYVKSGQVKWTRRAYERVQEFKGVSRNHAWGQVLKFSVDSKDGDPDDALDTFSYGVALALGNAAGF